MLQVEVTLDELEALRLSDLLGLYHETAAERMNVSRQTFGRIINSAHKKIAEALVNGKAISIKGGQVMPLKEPNRLGAGGNCICPKCNKIIAHPRGVPCQELTCADCGAKLMREGSYHHQLLKQRQEKQSTK